MSRIGKKPVPVPSGVTASLDGQTVKAKGPKGELRFTAPELIAVSMEGGTVKVDPRDEASPRAPNGACPGPWSRTSSPASPRASRSGSRSTASATGRPSPARC